VVLRKAGWWLVCPLALLLPQGCLPYMAPSLSRCAVMLKTVAYIHSCLCAFSEPTADIHHPQRCTRVQLSRRHGQFFLQHAALCSRRQQGGLGVL
jgi:hypothetical protein